jgi:hypothetical protein
MRIKDVKLRSPYTSIDRPLGLKEVQATRMYMQLEIVKLSALGIGRLYLQEIAQALISVTSSVDSRAM